MKKIIILCAAIAMLASCGKKPTASFTSDQTEISLGQSIQFTSTSTEAYYYHWKFGDGTSSREANPLHQFAKSGDFNVHLHVSNKGGDRWEDAYLSVKVHGYNAQFLHQWAILGDYTSESCGNNNQAYLMTINSTDRSDELAIYNFADYFDQRITATAVYGDPNKIEIPSQSVMSKTGDNYTVQGNCTISNLILTINYSLTAPSGTTVCGNVTGNGSGAQF